MSEPIAQMVRKGDAQSIQKYVKNHLPQDQPSLQRIYKELLKYDMKTKQALQPKDIIKQKTTHSSSMKMLPRKRQFINSNAPEEVFEKRTNTMIRILKEKGLKVQVNDQEQGLKVYNSQRKKIVAPLITNSKLLQGEQAEIDRLIQRYNANSDFYNNNIEDVHFDADTAIDRDMRMFIDRRQTVLQSLRLKKNNEPSQNSKYSSIQSKVFNKPQRRLSHQQIVDPRKQPIDNINVRSTKNLLTNCQNQLILQKFKKVPLKRNDFRDLQQKLNYEEGLDFDMDLAGIVNFQKVKEKLSKEQYDRYTHSYMKMMTNKTQEGSKCKLNSYAKQLLQDQRKMRNIIDFSQK